MKSSTGFRFQPIMLEIIRRYSWSDEKGRLLYDYLNLRPHNTVVEVGCGTGAFTRALAKGLNAGGRIIGFDRNGELLKEARRLVKNEPHSKKAHATFKKADVTKSIPLTNNFADNVVCQAFLWLFKDEDRKKVLSEMIRVCKRGGTIGAVEGAVDSSVSYVVNEGRLTRLLRKRDRAMIDGYLETYGLDRRIGYKLPTIFKELGLMRVRLDAVPDVRLECDDRIPLEFRIKEHQYYAQHSKKLLSKVSKLTKTNQRNTRARIEKLYPSLVTGGMKWTEIVELMRLEQSFHQRLFQNPQLIAENTSVDAGIHFITTGVKP